VTAGLLAGPQPHLALPNESGLPAAKPEGLQKLLDTLNVLNTPVQPGEEYVNPADEAERVRREEIDKKVRDYLIAHPEARYGELLKPAIADLHHPAAHPSKHNN
jgi:hypothetical protein